MGLDMYLRARKPLFQEEAKNAMKFVPQELTSNVPFISPSLSFCVAYWRKANAIHAWFVDNVQGGNDDCGEYLVSRKNLSDLKDVCYDVLNAIEFEDGGRETAKSLLPPREGFFFGGYDIDEYYINDLKYTIKVIENLEKIIGDDYDWEFNYLSSW